ncbi:hypothetical protein MHSWG343_06890 [Candidatus Mycoplasma haematohominis]|uniref:Uncharacterized protein n=1 Tax=Candidatus Mycoplasma haematohominis TaxID=1494318 RepID=A0A478FT81_9MOLU|nr:hypothetical protein MHSWG343_06890 [Candidatus Mycoplasma haemohominis]
MKLSGLINLLILIASFSSLSATILLTGTNKTSQKITRHNYQFQH